jgi:hypothetical protein
MIDSYLYFQARQDAESAGMELRTTGFHVEIEQSATGSDWLCLASKWILPEHELLIRLRISLTDLARKFRGVYDGWETQVGDNECGAG